MSEDVHQQPRLSWVNIEGNFFPVLKNIFKYRKIGMILNSLPARSVRCPYYRSAAACAVVPARVNSKCNSHSREGWSAS